VMQVASGEREKVIIHGDDYDTPDGTGIRDYIHVEDLARGHLAAYNHMQREGVLRRFETYNLGTGQGTSVLDIISLVSMLIGRSLPCEIGPRRPGDLASVYCDPTRAREILGWQTERSVKEAIEDSLNYMHHQKK
jgi:UDP-glucose 4-epimerase